MIHDSVLELPVRLSGQKELSWIIKIHPYTILVQCLTIYFLFSFHFLFYTDWWRPITGTASTAGRIPIRHQYKYPHRGLQVLTLPLHPPPRNTLPRSKNAVPLTFSSFTFTLGHDESTLGTTCDDWIIREKQFHQVAGDSRSRGQQEGQLDVNSCWNTGQSFSAVVGNSRTFDQCAGGTVGAHSDHVVWIACCHSLNIQHTQLLSLPWFEYAVTTHCFLIRAMNESSVAN